MLYPLSYGAPLDLQPGPVARPGRLQRAASIMAHGRVKGGAPPWCRWAITRPPPSGGTISSQPAFGPIFFKCA